MDSHGQPQQFSIPLRPSELADLLGLAPAEVDRALADLEARRLVRRLSSELLVLDGQGLRAWVQSQARSGE